MVSCVVSMSVFHRLPECHLSTNMLVHFAEELAWLVIAMGFSSNGGLVMKSMVASKDRKGLKMVGTHHGLLKIGRGPLVQMPR